MTAASKAKKDSSILERLKVSSETPATLGSEVTARLNFRLSWIETISAENADGEIGQTTLMVFVSADLKKWAEAGFFRTERPDTTDNFVVDSSANDPQIIE